MPRRGSASPPQRTAEEEADAEGKVPSDTGDRYVDFDGASHGPVRRADHTELAKARAEIERLRVTLEMHRDRERAQTLGARARDLDREAKMLFRAMETETETKAKTKTTTTSEAAARGPPARPRGRWGPRRKPRAPPSQRASQPAPRGRAISASKRGRVHRR